MRQEDRAHNQNLKSEVDELIAVSDILRTDLEHLLRLEAHMGVQPWRRNHVRTSWALVEGYVFRVKKFILKACNLFDELMSAKEKIFLEEGYFEFIPKKGMRWKRKFGATIDNLKQSFKFTANKLNQNWYPDFSGPGFASINKSLELRNRVVHPKTVIDQEVVEKDFEEHLEAIKWFVCTWNEFMQELKT